METFVIKIGDKPTDVTRDKDYKVTYVPKQSLSGTEITKTGIVLGLTLSLRFLRLSVGGTEFEIPVDEITAIEQL